MAPCTHACCDQAATKRVRYPFRYIDANFTGEYCDEHANEILSDAWSWPGARVIADLTEAEAV